MLNEIQKDGYKGEALVLSADTVSIAHLVNTRSTFHTPWFWCPALESCCKLRCNTPC